MIGDARQYVAQITFRIESVCPFNVAVPIKLYIAAAEGQVHMQRDHAWHMERLAEVGKARDGLLRATAYKLVDVTDAASVDETTRWWES